VLFLFLGRLNRDKGVLDLATAFSMACRLGKEIHLLIVGPDEGHMKEAIIDECKQFSSRLHFKDYTDSPQHYMAAADVLCLPSYREGFGLVVVEAASIGLPSIGSRIYGITDAILDGVTGFLHSPGNTEELAARMTTLINDRELRTKMGERARKRAHEQFSQRFVISEWMKYYRSVLDGRPRSQ
jgi:glycosyltransferase involved in cell wall biosynthesis